MSVIGGKAEVIQGVSKSPLIANSGHFVAFFAIVGLSLRITMGNIWTNWINTKERLRAMAIKRVWIEEGCCNCGLSEDVCPEVFKLGDLKNTVIEGVDFSRFEDQIKEAAEICPAEFIKFE